MSALLFENVQKIAVLKAGALGDLIVALPAIEAIRIAYPKAEIVLLGRLWHKYFLSDKRTSIDRVVVVPPTSGIVDEGNIDNEMQYRFFDTMQNEAFDIAINFQGRGVAANPFIHQLKARLTVGLSSPGAMPLDRSIPYYYYQSEVIRNLEVAALIGAKPESLSPEVKVISNDKIEADAVMKQLGISDDFVVLHSCAMDFRRMWPLEKFASLADKLAQQGFQVVFTGSAADDPKVQCIIDQMQYPAINTCGKLSLNGLVGLLAKCALVISSDTGPLHLARAIRVKTVGIYWAPNLINWGPLSRTIHRPVVSWDMECPACRVVPNNPFPYEPQTSGCRHEFSFVRNVDVDEVLEAAMDLLKEKCGASDQPLEKVKKNI